MAEDYEGGDNYFYDLNIRMRDLEEKLKILKGRMDLVGEGVVEAREKNFEEIQDMKKDLEKMKMKTERVDDFLKRLGEKIGQMAKRDELMILQRQFDMFRGD